MDVKGFYAVLEIDENASEKEIKAAFYKQVKIYHPDKNPDPDAAAIYLKLTEAYRVLSDPAARKIYDADQKSEKDPFIACSKCGAHAKQLRHILFPQHGAYVSGVFCRSCAKRHQFVFALKNWLTLPFHPLQSLKNLKSVLYLSDMPDGRNFDLLMNNARSFRQDGRNAAAYACARQAYKFAQSQSERTQAALFQDALPPTDVFYEKDVWHTNVFDFFRVFMPVFLLMVVVMAVTLPPLIKEKIIARSPESFIDYKPVSVLPASLKGEAALYHTYMNKTPVYQAPCIDCAEMTTLSAQSTVRLTGFVPRTQWVRITTDQGWVGFVKRRYLKEGAGALYTPFKLK